MTVGIRAMRVFTAALASVALVITACTPSQGPVAQSGAASATASAQPKRGGELRVQLLRDTSGTGYDTQLGIDATSQTIGATIFDTLIEAKPDGSFAPSLAESWTISPDGLSYTLKIRTGVKFHNGRTMTSDDVKYSIDRVRAPETKSLRRVLFLSIASVEVPDASTVVIKLSKPFAPFLSVLADISAVIVPKEVIGAQGNLDANPVGTGAFKFVSWKRDESVKVVANPDYWRPGLPWLDAITFTFNADSNARTAALRSGAIDFLWNAPPELFLALQTTPGLTVNGGKGSLQFQSLVLNMQKEPFKDVRVRQAIYWALNRDEIVQVSRPYTATVLNAGFLPPEHWGGVKDTVYKQDYDKAKQLLKDAGYENGFKFPVTALSGSDFHILTAQAIQQQLKPLKIDVDVQIVDATASTRSMRDGTFIAYVSGASSAGFDPDQQFSNTFMTGGGTNYPKFSDAKVDELITRARETTNQAERGDLYRQAQLRISEVGAWAFTYNYHPYDALQAYVKGYVFNPQVYSYGQLRDVWLDR